MLSTLALGQIGRFRAVRDNDPYFSSVVLLAHFDDSGDLDKDHSSYNDTSATLDGTPDFEGTTTKFGGGSMYVGSETLLYDDAARFTLGSGDFTVEAWFNPSAIGGNTKWIMGQSKNDASDANASFGLHFTSSSKLYGIVFHTGGGAGYIDITGGTTVTTSAWHHIALCRSGADLRLFLDGTQEGSTGNVSTYTIRDSAYKVGIGGLGEYLSNRCQGYFDDVRITVGVARYTANFTPSAVAFPNG